MRYIDKAAVHTQAVMYGRNRPGMKRTANRLAKCKDYLQGLPTVCCVPFWNNEILELLEKEEITRKTESARYTLIEQYWSACGGALYAIVKKGN